ncbi:MAG TPA: putative Ig domain-containing protein [Steroidobacter sp.]|nr:putative Ig domain-containing protein [Steroidobacter sp.]
MTTGTMTAMSQAATCAPGAILKAPGATRTDGVMFAAAPVRLFAGAIARAITRSAAVCVAALSLAGCLDGGSDDSANAAEPPPTSPADSSSNSPPEIAGTPDGFVEAGGAYSFKPSASDPDDDFLEFKATNVPGWARFNEETGELSGSPTEADVGETEDITITVTDGRDTRSIGPFRIRVNPPGKTPAGSNTAPTISGEPPASVIVGAEYRFEPVAVDAEADRLRFSVSNRPSWAKFSSSTGVLSGTPTASNVGTYANIVITVNDGQASASLPPFAIQVQGPDNNAPMIGGTPAASVQAGQTYSFQPSASDPDGDALTYAITNRPTWASFSTSTGRLSGAPTADHVGVYSNIVISVSDGRASAELAPFSIEVTAAPNHAPTISGTPATSVNAGVAYSFTPSASDADGDTLGFSIRNRPSWASFDTASGRLSGTPTSGGVYGDIVISVSDGKASASLPAFSITVNAAAVNRAPTISGTPGATVTAGAAYSFQPNASDPDGDTLTYSIQNRPSWASFDANTGRLAGAPNQSDAGVYSNIVISVSDGKASASLAPFSITVSAPVVGSATLSWTPPTQNTDGSTLTNLAGYRIVYGASPTTLNRMAEVDNPGLTTYVVTGLNAGTWYFAVKAYTSSGVESALSNVASKSIQ